MSASAAALVHEDARIVAADKPAGQATVPGRGDIGEPLSEELRRRLGARLWTVHRLDREASGLVVFAKDAATHRLLCAEFVARRAAKEYAVAVLGALSGEGKVGSPLREFGSGRSAPSPEGKPAVTLWRARRALRGATLLSVEPRTGRRHQIRAHLASIGRPVLGDPLYGPPPRPVGGAPRLLLHARKLALKAGEESWDLACEPGADFEAALAAFRPAPPA